MSESAEIRNKFLDFFKSKGHFIVPSAPIVIKNDPSLLFTNAGMNQFKDFFLGNRVAPHTRVADTQKCLRVSGKHNDLEEVGVDSYHHTMFEMLGNWSFGDYFKKEAIAWSWELLTAVYQIPKDQLYITVFGGDASENLPEDEEAWQEWKKWVSPERILPGSKKDNFWEMGDTGPCGPCTEIHVDCRTAEERASLDGSTLVNKDHPQVIEIWNNVFIQFNRLKSGALEPLPAKHVDTGMGFERLVRVLQNKQSNYDTDIFTGTISATGQYTGKTYAGTGDGKSDIAFRVIADHIRAICFTIADGQLPSNTGAGYVIRRILRRAVRYYYTYLDYKQPLLYQLVPLIAAQFARVFPELKNQEDFVKRVVQEEEEAFLRTLEKGLKRIDDIIAAARKTNSGSINGSDAFELFDTYGFPVDLTRLVAAEGGLSIDETGFTKELQKQKDRSRAATVVDAGDWIDVHPNGTTKFTGYKTLEGDTEVSRYRKMTAKGIDAYQLILKETPFYAESGGQVGDTGFLQFGNESIEVTDTKKENNLTIHFTKTIPVHIQETVHASVDALKRKQTEIHHTATHLLHAALRKVLGTHVAQKGSLVNPDQLRFDFSHFSKLTDEEMAAIEKGVNEKIRENVPVIIKEMPKDEALALGAMALFGEKYGDLVRVVVIDPLYSVELCGGTHVGSTGELGFFKIEHESAVAAGVRRIVAVCGKAAEDYINAEFDLMKKIKEALKNPKDLNKAVQDLFAENGSLRKKIESQEAKELEALKNKLETAFESFKDISFLGASAGSVGIDALKKLSNELRQSRPNAFVILTAVSDAKPFVAIAIDEKLANSKNLDAAKIIKEQVAPLIKGGGGGQKTLASAGGQDLSQLAGIIEKVKTLL